MPLELSITLALYAFGVAGCVWAYWTAEDDPAELIDLGLSGPNKQRAKELNDEFARAMGGAKSFQEYTDAAEVDGPVGGLSSSRSPKGSCAAPEPTPAQSTPHPLLYTPPTVRNLVGKN